MIVLVCGGIVGIVWGIGEFFWGRPALVVFAFGGVFTIYCAVDYYLRVARHFNDR